jgi:hypothetical protein
VLSSLGKFEKDGRPADQKLGFQLPEMAVNEYLAYALRNNPRPGITAVKVTLLPKNEISSVVSIDFDALRDWSPDLLPEPLRPALKGTIVVRVNAEFRPGNGAFTLVLKDAEGPNGVTIPKKLMERLVHLVASRQPEAYDTDHPIPYPFGLKRVWTEKQLFCGEN